MFNKFLEINPQKGKAYLYNGFDCIFHVCSIYKIYGSELSSAEYFKKYFN